MVLPSNGGKLFVKVKRGTKPKLKLNENSREALVSIPCDHTANWPVLRERMDGGLTITVQRLEQQYKIIIQHVLDKKPSVCVYVNSVANDKILKTCVKLINSQMSHIGVAGPNLEVTGTIKAQKVTFESTFGPLHTNAKLTARHVTLNAQHIFIKPEAMYACQTLQMMSRKVQIDGKIYPVEKKSNFLRVLVDSALLHIGVDGLIGAFRSPGDRPVTKSTEIIAERLVIRLKGSLANYGRILSKISIDMHIDGNILSLEDGRIDSAGRGYTALKQIKGISSDGFSSLPTTRRLSKAIESQKPDTVAQLLEGGVDPNDVVTENSVCCTPKKIAGRKYKEIHATEQRNKYREKITVIQALMVTYGWRRGLISSTSITAKIGRDCKDCAQFQAAALELTTLGSAHCENDSIWTCGSVLLYVSHDLFIEGQVKNQDFTVNCGGNIVVQQDAIISQETFTKINCSELHTSGIWAVNEQISIEATNASFSESSFLEADFIDIRVDKQCQHGGTWQANHLDLLTKGWLRTLHDGKVICDETAKVSALNFHCSGVWKVVESFQINIKESANFQPKSVINANLLKLVNEGCCIFSGTVNLKHLVSYVRNDLITTGSGKIIVGVSGTVATGAFRNDASWLSECNLSIHAACFEQSDDALIYAKDTFTLAVYDRSEKKSRGRIVANRCMLKINQKVRFDGYIRVNQIEIYLPYSNESQCILGGQLEVMYGPLVLKGRSEFSLTQPLSTGHTRPAFILEGQLKAEAIIAPFLAVRFAETSYALLSGMPSVVEETPYKPLLSAGAIYTMRASFIDSGSDNNYPEAILCASNWVHEGQIRFRGSKAFIITDTFINRGRMTNEGRLQNHMHSVYVSVRNRFENESVFSADKMYISGTGKLENKNRIFATDTMQIRLSNFSNEDGKMASIKLLSAGKEWNKVNGHIDVKAKSDKAVSKLNMETKNLGFRMQIKLSAQSQLHVNKDIVDEKAAISFSARDAVIFDSCKIVTESVELKVGDAYETEVTVCKNSSLQGHHLRFSGRCKLLTVVVNGYIEFDSVIFDSYIRNVKIIGKGSIISKNSLNFDGKSAIISLAELHASEILGTYIEISPTALAKIVPVKNTTATTIYADNCAIQGKIFAAGKLNLKATNGVVRVDGDLIGTSMMSEVSVEGNDVILIGNVSNLEFLEIYARRRIEYCETATIANAKNIAIEAETVAFDGTLSNFDTVIVTAEEIIVEGSISNAKCGNASVFGKNIRFEGVVNGLSKLEISCRGDAYMAGTFSHIDSFSVDAKWINCDSNSSSCKNIKFSAYSAIMDGKINCEIMTVNALGVIFIYNSIESKHCSMTGAVIIALTEAQSIPSESDVAALIYITDNPLSIKNTKKVHTTVLFTSGKNNVGVKQQWQNAIDIFRQSFQSSTTNRDFMTAALDDHDQLQASNYSFSCSSDFYSKMKTLANRFHLEHASIFSCTALLELMQQQVDLLDEKENNEGSLVRSEFEAVQLTETMNDLKMHLLKYTLQSPRSSVDDYGYASRSSSEDNDDKLSFRASPTISVTKCEEHSGSSIANATYEQPDADFDGYNRYLSVPCSISASNDGSAERDDDDLIKENEMSYVLNGERKIPIVHIDFDCFDIAVSRPRFEIPRQPTPTTDLALKKLQVKTALSNLDLRSFGSESSLTSFSTVEPVTPVRIVRSPLRKRSLIPRSSLRKMSAVVN